MGKQVSCGCLGAGTGAGPCPASPFRAEPSEVQHGDGCPEYAECGTEYGYCHPRSSWISGFFRDCNGESNGQELPEETVQAERVCSGEVLEETLPPLTSPPPFYLPLKESRTGKAHRQFKNRFPGGNVDGVGAGGGKGHGKRGPKGPVGGIGGVGGNGPSGPNGNCAWDGPGACAGRGGGGRVGGIGGVGGDGGIGQEGWAGPKPNCAWNGPGGCKKGNKEKTGKSQKINNRIEQEPELATETIYNDYEDTTELIDGNGRTDNDSHFDELLYSDYSEDDLSYDLSTKQEDDFIFEYIDELDNSENNIEKRKAATSDRFEPSQKKAVSMFAKKASGTKVLGKSSISGSDLWSVPQWLKHG